MLTSLRRAGILRSIRGPRGGYQLSRSPSEIKVSEVVACLEGDSSHGDANKRQSPEFQVLETLVGQLENARHTLPDSNNLQDLLEQRHQLAPVPGNVLI